MLREIVHENFLSKILDDVIKFGIRNSKYVASIYATERSQSGGKPVSLTEVDYFENDTLATGFKTGVFKANGEKFIGVTRCDLLVGNLVMRYPLKKFDNLKLPVYVIRELGNRC